MDKRQEKTIKAIYDAFTKLINNKDYDEITIQDILDESSVGRSTFYCHFKTKNDMLLKISNDIFEHFFSNSLKEEKSHDFSKDLLFDYKHLITHILYHLYDERDLIKGIFLSKGNTLFIEEFKRHLFAFADSYFKNYPYRKENDLPLPLKKDLLVESFISILKYWISDNFLESPEQITDYFITIFKSM